jgi:flagellar motility protein MotE (MotC chaperone)
MNIRLSRVFAGLLVLALLKLGLMFGLKAEPVARLLGAAAPLADMAAPEAEAAQQEAKSQKPDAKKKAKKKDEDKGKAESAPAQAQGQPQGQTGQAPAPADSPFSPASAQAQTPPQSQAGANATQSPPVGNPAENDWNALKRREEELTRREQALKTLEGDLDIKLAKLASTEKSIKKMLEEANVMKDQKLKHLVDVYSGMKAKQAASVVETLDEDLAVKILSGMRGQQAGEILTFVNPKKAAALSEALTKLQIPFGK